MNNHLAVAQLHTAAGIVEQLDREGIRLVAFSGNGRRVVLLIERPPAFVRGACKRRETIDGVLVQTWAAPCRGCQLEWLVCAPAAREVANG